MYFNNSEMFYFSLDNIFPPFVLSLRYVITDTAGMLEKKVLGTFVSGAVIYAADGGWKSVECVLVDKDVQCKFLCKSGSKWRQEIVRC